MKLYHLVVDDFLEDFAFWREWADVQTFKDEVNPVDGVIYPGICKAVPSWGIQQRLNGIMGVQVTINSIFMRLSPAGANPPHWAHNDASMGQYSLMLYLNRPEHCQGGTALLEHKLFGLRDGPRDEEEMEAWKQNTNDADAWKQTMVCEMKTNRAFIFRSELMHAALPVSGFGKDAKDGRLVLTAFFNA